MFNRLNNFNGNIINKISFGAKPPVPNNPLKIEVPKDSKEAFITADKCLEGLNRGGISIHFTDKDEQNKTPLSKESQDLIDNLLLYSDKNKENDKLCLYDTLSNFSKLNAISTTNEERSLPYSSNKKTVERRVLEDGSIIDKDLYSALQEIKDKPDKKDSLFKVLAHRTDSSKINIGDYEIFIFARRGRQLATNILDKNNNTVIAKGYKKGDGTVIEAQKIANFGYSNQSVSTKLIKEGALTDATDYSGSYPYIAEELSGKI